MRKILYPFFLLSLIAGIYYFFGENFSPLMQKILFVFGLAFAFFLFRGLFLFFFDWIFESFSNLFKTIIAAILFVLVALGIWGALPEHSAEKIKSIFTQDSRIGESISSFSNGVTEGVKNTGENIADAASNTTEAISEAASDTADSASEAASDTIDSIANAADAAGEGVKSSVSQTGDILEAGLAQVTEDRTPTHLLKNIKVSSEESTSEAAKLTTNSEVEDEISAWKKPVVSYLPEDKKGEENNSHEVLAQAGANMEEESSKEEGNTEEKEESAAESDAKNEDDNSEEKGNEGATDKDATTLASAEKTNAHIAQMKKSGVRLVSSGPSKEDYTVVFRERDAQVVFPVEYRVYQVLWTDSEETLDRVDFAVETPNDTNANISISLSESGETFEKFFTAFKNTSSEENQFFIAESSENSLTYVTFFEGILWEITISLGGENLQEEDFYNILLPISFQKEN